MDITPDFAGKASAVAVPIPGTGERPPRASKMSALEHYNRNMPSVGMRCAASRSPDKNMIQRFGRTDQWLVDEGQRNDARGDDAYHACATYKDGSSRKAHNVEAVRSFWLDVDVGEGAGKYRTRKEAVRELYAFCKDVGLPAPDVVDSGKGFHVYWPMDADMTPDEWLPVARMLKRTTMAWGLKADPTRTADITSLLRPIGTHHRKGEPLEVVALAKGTVGGLAPFRAALERYMGTTGLSGTKAALKASPASNDDLSGGMEYPPSSAEKIAKECAVIQLMRDTRGNVDQPTWYGTLGVIVFTKEGKAKCHEWSDGHPQYSRDETDRKIAQASKFAPTTCAKLSDAQPDLCRNCPHFGKITSPISLGYEVRYGAPAKRDGSYDLPPFLSEMAHVTDEVRGIDNMNLRYAWADCWGDEGTYLRFDEHGRPHPAQWRVIEEAMAPYWIERHADNDVKMLPLAKAWKHSPRRRIYDRVIFAPGGYAGGGGRVLNLWTGMAIAPARRRCMRMLRHMFRVICRRNRGLFEYLMDWMALLVQKPEVLPGTALLLQSEREGTGKSTVANWVVEWFGPHAQMVSDPEHVVGKFNAHLETCVALVVNEPPFAGDHGTARKLKAMITEPKLLVEAKFKTPHLVDNHVHIIITTNERWAVSAGSGARRFVVFDVDDCKAGDHAYFHALHTEAEAGGKAGLLHLLMSRDISKFNPRDIPITEALREQQRMSAGSEYQWGLDLLERDDLPPGITFGQPASAEDIYHDYLTWAGAMNLQRRLSQTALGRWLGRIGLQNLKVGTARRRHWALPSRDEFHAMLEKAAGIR